MNANQNRLAMQRIALRMLQVSAAYFALGSALPSMPGHQNGIGSRTPPSAHRLAAGAWPMIAVPMPFTRKKPARA